VKLSSLNIEVINRYRASQCIVSMAWIGTYYLQIYSWSESDVKGEK
jgi:hypothetical protein